MKPLLKWPGGKRRLAENIATRISQQIGDNSRYIELCAGGAAVFFYLEPKRAVLVDVCKPLISFYEAVRREPDAFYDELLKILALPHCEETYQKIKGEWNGNDFGVRFAARLLYLNRTGFNGLFRLNERLEYTVAWGKKEKLPAFPSRQEIRAAAELLQRATIYHRDFSYVLRSTHAGDVVYVDPPYWGTYDRYSGGEFPAKKQRQLASGLQRAVKRGVSVYASNIDCEDIRRLYAWANIDVVPVQHKIGCTADSRKMVNEVIAWSTSPSDPRQMKLFAGASTNG